MKTTDFESIEPFATENKPQKWIDGKASSKKTGDYSWSRPDSIEKESSPLPQLPGGIANEIRISVKNVYVDGKPLDLSKIRDLTKGSKIGVELKVEHRGAGMNLKMGKWKGYDLSIYTSDLVD